MTNLYCEWECGLVHETKNQKMYWWKNYDFQEWSQFLKKFQENSKNSKTAKKFQEYSKNSKNSRIACYPVSGSTEKEPLA